MSLSEIVTVNISRETAAVSQAGFGTCLILGKTGFGGPELVREYASITAVAEDFSAGDYEYKAAAALFGQTPKVTKVKIAEDDSLAGKWTITLNQVMGVGDSISVDINDVTVTQAYSAGAADTTSLANKIALQPDVASAVVSGADKIITVTFKKNENALVDNKVVVTSLGLTVTIAEVDVARAIGDVLADISVEDDDWYGLVCESIDLLDVQAVAASIEAQRKLYATRSAASGILSAGSTTDIAYILKNAGYDRSIVIYSGDTDEQADAAMFGVLLPSTPGSLTMKFKSLSGVSADALTATEATAAKNKNCNIYRSIGGVNMVSEGVVASGEFIDVMHGIDWLQARIEEGVFGRLARSAKVPYTQAGAVLIEAEIRQPLDQGIVNGLLASYTVTVPDVASASANDKAARFMDGFAFEGILAGAIHKVQINGTITL